VHSSQYELPSSQCHNANDNAVIIRNITIGHVGVHSADFRMMIIFSTVIKIPILYKSNIKYLYDHNVENAKLFKRRFVPVWGLRGDHADEAEAEHAR